MSSRPSATSSSLNQHRKKKIVVSRPDGQFIRQYLEAIGLLRSFAALDLSRQEIVKRLGEIKEELETADFLDRLDLRKEQRELEIELSEFSSTESCHQLEQKFVEVSKSFSQLHHISYETWRTFGVCPQVLERAGIHKSSHT